MKRLLLSCPSRGRPELLEKMLASYIETRSPNTDLVIYIDTDEPRMKEYKIRNGDGFRFEIGERMNVAQIHNHIILSNRGYDYYMPVNDDLTFITKDWGNKLIDCVEKRGAGWGIAYPDDSTDNATWNLPTFGMMSANIVNLLGYFYPLEIKMMHGDAYLLDLGRAIGKLFYCPDVVFKHSPPGVASGAFVPGDHRASDDFLNTERRAYAKYIDNNLDRDVNKILDVLCEGIPQ